eukprot:5394939-Pyramimonas_sp.AAC.1
MKREEGNGASKADIDEMGHDDMAAFATKQNKWATDAAEGVKDDLFFAVLKVSKAAKGPYDAA